MVVVAKVSPVFYVFLACRGGISAYGACHWSLEAHLLLNTVSDSTLLSIEKNDYLLEVPRKR